MSDYRYFLTGSIDHASCLCKAGYLSHPFCSFCMSSLETVKNIFENAHVGSIFGTPFLFYNHFIQEWGPAGHPATYVVVGFLIILILVLLCCMRLTNPDFFPSKLIYCIWLFTKTFSSQSGFAPGTSNPDSARFFFFPFVNILVLLILLGIAFPVHHVVLLLMVHLAERFRRDEQTWSARKPYHIIEKRK